jgi:hypothetical protein
MPFMRFVSLLVFIGLIQAPVLCDTLLVPDEYLTIQEAISAAEHGDTVRVKPGTYEENIIFLGKNIHVQSEKGPWLTTIDGGQLGSVVAIMQDETNAAVLDGFTITNGSGEGGGGIWCYGASPTIINNHIKENNVGNSGAGIACHHSSAKIAYNVISGNHAGWSGGGINANTATAEITHNLIHANTAGKRGGGVRCTKASIVLMNNTIFDNSGRYGGGVCSGASPLIANNLIFGNWALNYGGGIYGAATSPWITNNTIYQNRADEVGGGIACDYDSGMTVFNTILWDNESPKGNEIWIGTPAQPSFFLIAYCDVKGGQASVFMETGSTLDWGDGMIDADPQFVDAVEGDLHLLYLSPCKNAGSNSAPYLPEVDHEEDARVYQGTVDMGADEFHPHLYYTGDGIPGGEIEVKVIGEPGASPVDLWLGSGLLDPPLPSPWGDWYLAFPLFGPYALGVIHTNGLLILPGTLPVEPPGPYSLPMQAWIDGILTNYCLLEVRPR